MPTPPLSGTQQLIADVWAETVPDCPVLDSDTNFFDIGGNSLLAARVALRLQQRLNTTISLVLFFEHSSLGELAEALDALRMGILKPSSSTVEAEGPLLATISQRSLWFLDRLGSGSAYNTMQAFQLRGEVDVDALSGGVDGLMRRHEVLRTVYGVRANGLAMRVLPWEPGTLAVEDLLDLPPEARMGQALARAEEEASRRIDLANGPILRALLVRTAEDEHLLVLVIHHIACDFWSLGVIARDLSLFYSASVAREDLDLPDLEFRYRDYARWQERLLGQGSYASDLEYWRSTLGGAVELRSLPTDRPRPAIQTFSGATWSFDLGGECVERLRAIARIERASVFMVLLAVLDIVLFRYSGESDVVVGTPIVNRPHACFEDVVGLFINTLPLRVDVSGDPTFLDLLRRVRTAALGAYAHRDVPFERLVDALQPQRSLAFSPVYQVMLSMDMRRDVNLDLPGIASEVVLVHRGTSKLDVILHVADRGDRLNCMFEYNTDLFETSTIGRLAESFSKVLEEATKRPLTNVSRLMWT